MNALTKRYIFCACGGTSGAMFSLQFTNSWAVLVVAVLMAVVGWIAADADAFLVKVKEALWKVVGKELTRTDRFKVWLLLLYALSLVATQLAVLICLSAFVLLPAVTDPLAKNGDFRSALFFLSVLCFAFAALAGIEAIYRSANDHNKEKLWKAVGYANPIRWLPMLVIGFVDAVLEVVKWLHTDERAVYAVCFALGTLGGFWVGKHFGVPFGSIAGGVISLGIAWLDWKILSIKFGWRQAV